MPMITDWLMVAITAIYVIATILICGANILSAKATRAQVEEMEKEHRENIRMGVLPYFQVKYEEGADWPEIETIDEEISLNACLSSEEERIIDFGILRITNLGKGLATNICINRFLNEKETYYELGGVKTLCHGETITIVVSFTAGCAVTPKDYSVKFVLSYEDCLENAYSQSMMLQFHVEDTTHCNMKVYRMDSPKLQQKLEEKENA